MIPDTISHYRIIKQLGAGRMGGVHSAYDPKINRLFKKEEAWH